MGRGNRGVQPSIERFVLERLDGERYQALAVESDARCWLVEKGPRQVRTWSYLGAAVKFLERQYPGVEHFELRLRPSR